MHWSSVSIVKLTTAMKLNLSTYLLFRIFLKARLPLLIYVPKLIISKIRWLSVCRLQRLYCKGTIFLRIITHKVLCNLIFLWFECNNCRYCQIFVPFLRLSPVHHLCWWALLSATSAKSFTARKAFFCFWRVSSNSYCILLLSGKTQNSLKYLPGAQ